MTTDVQSPALLPPTSVDDAHRDVDLDVTPRRGLLARRWRQVRGPALLYVLLAGIMISPFYGGLFRYVGDLYGVIGGFVEARNAILELQFPLRVPPHSENGVRYPIFQFYGNTPFTVGGIVYALLPVDPYVAWKVTSVLVLTVGALFTYALARRLTRRRAPSVLAGAVFMTSPYMFADIMARGAYTEFFAFNLLPVALYFAWRCYKSPKLRHVCLSAIAWTLLGTSHNITYMYGVVLFGTMFLMLAALQLLWGDAPRGRVLRRLARVVVAGVVHLAMVAWYLAPQVAVVKDLIITARFTTPMEWAKLTSLHTLFRPFAFTPPESTTTGLTLQVGAVIVIGVVLALLALLRPGTAGRYRAAIVCMTALFAVSLFLVWSPFDVWRWLPEQLGYVQFPYRILMFVALFGSLLTALGVALLRRRGFEPRKWQVWILLAGLGATAGTYLPRDGVFAEGLPAKQAADPIMGGLEDYHFLLTYLAPTSRYHPDLNFAEPEWGLAGREFLPADRYLIRRPADIAIPTPQSAKSLRVEGTLPPEAAEVAAVVVFLGESSHAEPVTPGPFAFSMPVTVPLGGQPVRLGVYAVAPGVGGQVVDVRVSRIQFEPSPDAPVAAPASVDPPLLAAQSLRPKMRYGRRSKITLQLDRPSIVQLPVLYYPGLLSVNDNRKPVAYGNLGRFVALELGAGEHKLDVTFKGVTWANYASAIGWSLVLVTLLALWVRHRIRTAAQRRRERLAARAGAAKRPADPNRFTPMDAVAGCAAVVLGGLAAEGALRAARYQARDLAVGFAADRPDADANLVLAHAFDDLPNTAWAVGSSQPVTLTLTPPKPAVLQGIELHSRETSLYETWKTVRVVCSLNGATVFEQSYTFDNAHVTPVQTIEMTPTQTDRIQLYFSDPVVLTPTKKRVSEEAVNPGYREIKLKWVRP